MRRRFTLLIAAAPARAGRACPRDAHRRARALGGRCHSTGSLWPRQIHSTTPSPPRPTGHGRLPTVLPGRLAPTGARGVRLRPRGEARPRRAENGSAPISVRAETALASTFPVLEATGTPCARTPPRGRRARRTGRRDSGRTRLVRSGRSAMAVSNREARASVSDAEASLAWTEAVERYTGHDGASSRAGPPAQEPGPVREARLDRRRRRSRHGHPRAVLRPPAERRIPTGVRGAGGDRASCRWI